MRDVDYITIDKTGKPHITFKSTSAMHDTSLMLGQLIENLNDVEEAGCERLSFLFVAVKWQDNNVIYTVYYVQILYLCMMGE